VNRVYRLTIVVGALLLMGIMSQSVAAQDAFTPTYEDAECAFAEPLGTNPICGYLTVPENRNDPDSNLIRLHVVTFPAVNGAGDAVPLIYLEGGPGGSALSQIDFTYDGFFSPYNQDRDLIIIDQRGTGFSEPNLSCPEEIELQYEILDDDLPIQELTAQVQAATTACHDRLVGQGIDLSGYNSRENAADLEALRETLEIESWDVWGISYGTKLALTYMRDYPDNIRTAILDSNYPLEENLFTTYVPNVDRAFSTFFDACAAEAACSAAYPDLENTFWATVDALNANKPLVEGTSPTTGEIYDLLLTGDLLIGFTFTGLYQPDLIVSLPQIITAVSNEDYSLFTLLYLAILENNQNISSGMYNAVQCVEEIPFASDADYSAQLEGFEQFEPFFEGGFGGAEGITGLCDVWQVEQASDLANQAVMSDIPTFVAAGNFDPITPPEWGQQVADTLSNAYFYNYPSGGHGPTLGNDCAAEMALAFLADPTVAPDDSCIADDVLVFNTPQESYSFETFTDESFGITGVYPEGWEEVAPGTYARSALGDVALVQLSVPTFDAESALGLITDPLGLEEAPVEYDQYSSPILEWVIYDLRTQGVAIRLALAEDASGSYVVLLQGTESDIDDLQSSILIPVLAALAPLN